jgi:hypothetical protein
VELVAPSQARVSLKIVPSTLQRILICYDQAREPAAQSKASVTALPEPSQAKAAELGQP